MAKEEKEVTRLSASTPHMSMFANNALLGGEVRVRVWIREQRKIKVVTRRERGERGPQVECFNLEQTQDKTYPPSCAFSRKRQYD